MRWQRLFQDLEDQLDSETDAELEDMARDEERLRVARLSLAERLRSIVAADVGVDGGNGPAMRVGLRIGRREAECTIGRVGRDWILAEIKSPQVVSGTAIIPLSAIGIIQLPGQAAVSRSLAPDFHSGMPQLANDIGMTFVLRDLCRRRRVVTILCRESEVSGTIDRVGRDHVDIAVHAVETPRTGVRYAEVVMISLNHVEMVLIP